jgi:outer membrane protein OmpA-like peptidoglycan-associated protein
MEEAKMRCPLCAVVGLVGFALFGWFLLTQTGARPAGIAADAEALAASQLSAAGFPWARLQIEDDVGHLRGEAPSAEAEAAALSAAQVLLQPMIGVPGVFARLVDDIVVVRVPATSSATAAPVAATVESPAVESAPAPAAAVMVAEPVPMADQPAESSAVLDANASAETTAPNAQVLAAPPNLPAWTGPSVPTYAHDVYVYPAHAVAVVDTAAAASCEDDIRSLLATETIRFATASAQLSPFSAPLLDRIASAIGGCQGMTLTIEGHTDSRGPADKNLRLSQSRAESVRAALIERGVPGAQLTAIGSGESRPLDSAESDAAWERNRRIEFSVSGAATGQ